MAKLVADHPDYVSQLRLDRQEHQTRAMDASNLRFGIWQTFADNNIPALAMRDTLWLVKDGQLFIRTAPAKGGNPRRVGLRGPRCWSIGIQPRLLSCAVPAARFH